MVILPASHPSPSPAAIPALVLPAHLRNSLAHLYTHTLYNHTSLSISFHLITHNPIKHLPCVLHHSKFLHPSNFFMSETETATAAAAAREEEKRKTVVVVGVDDSEHSYYALEWTLRYVAATMAGAAELVVVHAKPSPSSVVSLAGPGAAEVLPFVESDLRKIAEAIVEKARQLCIANSVSALLEVIEGDAKYVLCDTVEKHHADILVVGSHGYGAIKRAFLGSVSDYCTHHAHCSVLIVKKPKSKH